MKMTLIVESETGTLFFNDVEFEDAQVMLNLMHMYGDKLKISLVTESLGGK